MLGSQSFFFSNSLILPIVIDVVGCTHVQDVDTDSLLGTPSLVMKAVCFFFPGAKASFVPA